MRSPSGSQGRKRLNLIICRTTDIYRRMKCLLLGNESLGILQPGVGLDFVVSGLGIVVEITVKV